jgi:hypothetical protein
MPKLFVVGINVALARVIPDWRRKDSRHVLPVPVIAITQGLMFQHQSRLGPNSYRITFHYG